MSTSHRCMIVPSSYAELAGLLCKVLGGRPGDGMFVVGCESSITPAGTTHFINNGKIDAGLAVLMPNKTTGSPGDASLTLTLYQQNKEPTDPDITEQQIIDLYAAVDVSEEQPYEAMSRLNLQLTEL